MPWFSIKAQAQNNAGVAEIAIYEPIGSWDLTAAQFIAQVKALGDVSEIKLDINSPGGDVFDAITIFNFLKRHPAKVTVTVGGVAASAASLIAMAGDSIIMPNNTMMMIHNPWTWAMGNADELREQADLLDKVSGSLFATYQARTGMDEADLKAMLAIDTWLTAEECFIHGFCDEVTDPISANAKFDVSSFPVQAQAVYKSAQQLAQANAEAESDNEADPAELLGDGTEAEPFELAPDVPQTDLDDEDDNEILAKAQALAKEEALAYSKSVVELCALAGMPNKAASFIGASTSLDEVRAQLLAAKANNSQPLNVAQPAQKSWAQMSLTEKSAMIRENPTLATLMKSE
jgi:ATP-dependent protease ClpP protease subunit